MPKNKGKGGKNRRRGKNENDGLKRELDLKDEGQEYAQVTKILGNGRVRCMCFDGKERLCNIRGKMRRKVWIGTGDIILLGLRDFQDEKADVIQKYNPDEARRLKAQGHIPDNVQLDIGGETKEDDNIHFANDGDEIENEDLQDQVAPQQLRSLNMDYIPNLSDLDDESDSEEESESDEDDDEDFDYEKYALDKKNTSQSTQRANNNSKKNFDIDEI
jgi:translation initiation factor 1A